MLSITTSYDTCMSDGIENTIRWKDPRVWDTSTVWSLRWLEIIDYFRAKHFGNEIGEPRSFAARKMGVLTRLEGQFRPVVGREKNQQPLSSPVQNHGKPCYNFIALFVRSIKLRNLAYCSSCYASFSFPRVWCIITTFYSRYFNGRKQIITNKLLVDYY